MHQKITMAVDICNTIADVNAELENYFNVKRHQNVYHHPMVKDSNFFNEHLEIYEKAKPFEDAREVMWIINDYVKFVYLTARDASANEVTKDWLRKNDFPDGRLIFSKNKPIDFFREGCNIAVEDAPFELVRYEKEQIPCFAREQDYNSFFSGPRGNFYKLLDYILSKGVLLGEAI